MIKVAVLTIVSGLCMVGFYSWNVSIVNCGDIQEPTPSPQDMSSRANWEEDANLCTKKKQSAVKTTRRITEFSVSFESN